MKRRPHGAFRRKRRGTVVTQLDYETVLAALRDYLRITTQPRETWGVDEVLRLAEIRALAMTARPLPGILK